MEKLTSRLLLNNNLLSGPIPSELGKLTRLYDMDLSDNRLSGSIPTELGLVLSDPNKEDPNFYRHRFKYLIYNNSLTGTIPSELGYSIFLKDFNAERNPLVGTIPSELGQAVNLTFFRVADTDLSGSIPDEFGFLASSGSLLEVFLTNTDISGTLPEGLCNLQQEFLRFDCSESLCGCDCICISGSEVNATAGATANVTTTDATVANATVANATSS